MKYRRRYYFEIHLHCGVVFYGISRWKGMLDAERDISLLSWAISRRGLPAKGFRIKRIPNKARMYADSVH
jgi:hypothetical protein